MSQFQPQNNNGNSQNQQQHNTKQQIQPINLPTISVKNTVIYNTSTIPRQENRYQIYQPQLQAHNNQTYQLNDYLKNLIPKRQNNYNTQQQILKQIYNQNRQTRTFPNIIQSNIGTKGPVITYEQLQNLTAQPLPYPAKEQIPQALYNHTSTFSKQYVDSIFQSNQNNSELIAKVQKLIASEKQSQGVMGNSNTQIYEINAQIEKSTTNNQTRKPQSHIQNSVLENNMNPDQTLNQINNNIFEYQNAHHNENSTQKDHSQNNEKTNSSNIIQDQNIIYVSNENIKHVSNSKNVQQYAEIAQSHLPIQNNNYSAQKSVKKIQNNGSQLQSPNTESQKQQSQIHISIHETQENQIPEPQQVPENASQSEKPVPSQTIKSQSQENEQAKDAQNILKPQASENAKPAEQSQNVKTTENSTLQTMKGNKPNYKQKNVQQVPENTKETVQDSNEPKQHEQSKQPSQTKQNDKTKQVKQITQDNQEQKVDYPKDANQFVPGNQSEQHQQKQQGGKTVQTPQSQKSSQNKETSQIQLQAQNVNKSNQNTCPAKEIDQTQLKVLLNDLNAQNEEDDLFSVKNDLKDVLKQQFLLNYAEIYKQNYETLLLEVVYKDFIQGVSIQTQLVQNKVESMNRMNEIVRNQVERKRIEVWRKAQEIELRRQYEEELRKLRSQATFLKQNVKFRDDAPK